MAPNKSSVDSLKKLAATLNQETEDLNKLIEDLESELDACRIGVSIWLDVVLDKRTSIEVFERRNGDHEEEQIREGWDLGYCKVGDKWRFAVKRIRSTSRDDTTDQFGLEESVWADVGNPVPLVQAPRVVRVQAASLLDQLLETLHNRVEGFVKDIQAAKNLAKV